MVAGLETGTAYRVRMRGAAPRAGPWSEFSEPFTPTEEIVLSTQHPYDNSADDSWTLHFPGADGISIEFSDETRVENGCDHLTITTITTTIAIKNTIITTTTPTR